MIMRHPGAPGEALPDTGGDLRPCVYRDIVCARRYCRRFPSLCKTHRFRSLVGEDSVPLVAPNPFWRRISPRRARQLDTVVHRRRDRLDDAGTVDDRRGMNGDADAALVLTEIVRRDALELAAVLLLDVV